MLKGFPMGAWAFAERVSDGSMSEHLLYEMCIEQSDFSIRGIGGMSVFPPLHIREGPLPSLWTLLSALCLQKVIESSHPSNSLNSPSTLVKAWENR